VARLLGVSEGAVRYHLVRMAAGAVDGRGSKPFKVTRVAGAIEDWREAQAGAINLAALHEWLVSEHGYDGSLRWVQRFWASRYQAPAIRARRRVETPPGAQAQARCTNCGSRERGAALMVPSWATASALVPRRKIFVPKR
jgi:hypothetical protein